MEKGTHAMLMILDAAKKAAIPAKYVLFDSWFSSPSTLHAVKKTKYDVIGMVKKTSKLFFRYKEEEYVRNRNNRKEYLCLISTDVNPDENEIIRIYGKRWDIEVFFKVCKSYLNLSKECNSLSYDAMTVHTAIVFTRYLMLALEGRESNDDRSLGELFLYFYDEIIIQLQRKIDF